MKLSVIIINYNVRHFLEQCLSSCVRASEKVQTEIIVVDNGSVDGSEKMVQDKFPAVKYLYQRENLGFSKANNLAIQIAKGEYVLLLNPDTIVAEDTFEKCTRFMDSHPEAGGLGVKMIDGNGKFLPESKRGLPTPAVAFYKIFGLSALFPTSRMFGKYHLGYLDNDGVHEVDILSGAFMFMRRSALEKTGLLDETFFMYGEDIDLSYRIQKAGYRNYYFPGTTIVHYKGESTKKSSVNYVFVFYRAMVIFARKHFTGQHAGIFSFLIHLAIYFRATIAIAKRLLEKLALPLLDFTGILLFLYFIAHFYSSVSGKTYDPQLINYSLPAFSAIWVVANFFTGIYHPPFKWKNLLGGVVAGGALMLVCYSLLPESMRFSRAVILLGATGAFMVVAAIRAIAHFLPFLGFSLNPSKPKRIAIVGGASEQKRVRGILEAAYGPVEFIAPVYPRASDRHPGSPYVADITKVGEVIEVFRLNEIVFSGNDMPAIEILKGLQNIRHLGTSAKVAPAGSSFIISSNSVHGTNESGANLYFPSLGNQVQKRKKRLFDIGFSLFLLVTIPVNVWFVDQKKPYIANIFHVLLGNKTWVGYDERGNPSRALPNIPEGVVHPNLHLILNQNDVEALNASNVSYAGNYRWWRDAGLVWKYFHAMGRINP